MRKLKLADQSWSIDADAATYAADAGLTDGRVLVANRADDEESAAIDLSKVSFRYSNWDGDRIEATARESREEDQGPVDLREVRFGYSNWDTASDNEPPAR